MTHGRSYLKIAGWIFAALLILGMEAAAIVEITQQARPSFRLELRPSPQISQLK
jgi:hypothetical protein